MIEFIIPPFYGLKIPRYQCDGGPPLPALRSGYPALAPPLLRMTEPFGDCRRLVREYHGLQLLSWFTGACAGLSLALALLAYPFFRMTILMPNSAVLLALSVGFNYLAYRRFQALAAKLSARLREVAAGRLAETWFRHYDVTPHGIFPRSATEPGE